MSDLLPIFPLPNVVLFPNVFLPLHIFEPRYRDMIADATASSGDRLIGMVLLRPGWERAYDAQPPVYPIGCTGVITHVEQLGDGRYNIVLRGLERFRILDEDHTRKYRRAIVEPLADHMDEHDSVVVAGLRTKLEAMLVPANRTGGASDPRIPSAISDADTINALAQYLDLDALEKQALLERNSLRERAEALIELLEMKTIMARSPSSSNLAH